MEEKSQFLNSFFSKIIFIKVYLAHGSTNSIVHTLKQLHHGFGGGGGGGGLGKCFENTQT